MSNQMPTRRDTVLAMGTTAFSYFGMRAKTFAAEVPHFYFDSADGSDTNDGRTPPTAFQSLGTLAKLPRVAKHISLARGSRFLAPLRINSETYIDAYGSGPAPIIDGSIALERDRWLYAGPDTWVYNRALPYTEQVLFDTRPGVKLGDLTLEQASDTWFWRDQKLYIFCSDHPTHQYTYVSAITQTCIEIVDADGSSVEGIDVVNGIHGILGQRCRHINLSNCRATQCVFNGFYLADGTSGWGVNHCEAELNGGAGFALNYGARNNTLSNCRATKNHIDGCQFSEGCGSENLLVDCYLSFNFSNGINCKEKVQHAFRCYLEGNGETGAVAQINTEVLWLTECTLINNNRRDNGTMNLALEDGAMVRSSRNIFVSPYARDKAAVNVRLIGQSSLQSVADCFIDCDDTANVYASILVATSEPTHLNIQHGTFWCSSSSVERIIDCRHAAQLTLELTNTIVSGAGISLSFNEAAVTKAEYNCYFRSAGSYIIEVAGGRTFYVTRETLPEYKTAHNTETGTVAGNPDYLDARHFDLTLLPTSPARESGTRSATAMDAFGLPFGPRPNMGAFAGNGNRRVRLRL